MPTERPADKAPPPNLAEHFRRFAAWVSDIMGTPAAFCSAAMVVFLWAITGPHYHFSDTWQIVINTSTTIVTFLMVFILQTTQNRDSRAIHLKLDELIRAKKGARNTFTTLEDASDQELKKLREEFGRLKKSHRKHVLGDPQADERKAEAFTEEESDMDYPPPGFDKRRR